MIRKKMSRSLENKGEEVGAESGAAAAGTLAREKNVKKNGKNKRQWREERKGMNRWSGLPLFWCATGLSACGYSMSQLTGCIYTNI